MPILFVHGVSIRDDAYWARLEAFLRRYVAPIIAGDPENVLIESCYWGDLGAKFRWGGASTPRSPLREIASHAHEAIEKPQDKLLRISSVSQKLAKKAGAGSMTLAKKRIETRKKQILRLKDLTKERLSDLCATVIAADEAIAMAPDEKMLAIMAADEVAHEAKTFASLADCAKVEDEIALLQKLVRARYEKLRGEAKVTVGVKLPNLRQKLRLNLKEFMSRTLHGAGFAVTRAAAEVRSPLNSIVTLFIGDVFTYMHGRGNAMLPGAIPVRVIETLRRLSENKLSRNNEPIVVLSHSMGGQIMYDVVSHFLPRMPECRDLRVDFWCASASQIGLFEELKLFLESSDEYGSGKKKLVPFPDRAHLGTWWNVWDHNDFVSWSAKDIFEGVDDEGYNTGMFLTTAHGGYLELPSFFRKFAHKLERAKEANWMRPV